MSITRAVQPDLRKKRVNWQKVAVILLFAIVPMFLLILFTYIPFIKMIQFSFYNMSYTKNRGFVGLDNYLKVFSKSEYVGAMLLSLYYMAGAVVQLSLALLFASILSLERIRGAGIYKAIPRICSGQCTAGHRHSAGKTAVLAQRPEREQLEPCVYFRVEVLRTEHGALYRCHCLD